MNKINWVFIGTLEGRTLKGYVPDPAHSQSGVTIATGFDIGAMTDGTFVLLSVGLQQLVSPYRHLKGMTADAALKTRPLTISDAQANELDAISRTDVINLLESQYLHASGVTFGSLPEAAQTVIGSVTFQYGTPWARTPKFWGSSVRRDYSAMVAELNDFGDAYATRHEKEAAYLQNGIGAGV